MSDPLSGIKHIVPTWPVKPARPARDRKSGGGGKKPDRPEPGAGTDEDDGEDDGKPTIDEYI